MALGPAEVESPELLVLLWLGEMRLFPVDEEVCECLRLDCLSWLVVYVVDADFDRPLGNSFRCVAVADDVAEWHRSHHCDRVLLEVVWEVSSCPEDGVYQLL